MSSYRPPAAQGRMIHPSASLGAMHLHSATPPPNGVMQYHTAARSSPVPLHPSTSTHSLPTTSNGTSRRGFTVPAPVTSLPSRDRGRDIGMKNLGNTCYLSAVLQALLGQRCFVSDLLHTAQLLGADTYEMSQQMKERRKERERRKEENLTDDEGENDLLQTTSALSETFYHTLLSLVLQMRENSHGILDTARLRAMISSRYKKFAGSDQQDAHEFLSECLSQLDEDIQQVMNPANAGGNKRNGEDMDTSDGAAATLQQRLSPNALQLQVDTISPIYRNLHCEIETRLTCVKCAYSRTRSENFNDISLDLPDPPAKTHGGRSASPAASSSQSQTQSQSATTASFSPPPLSPPDSPERNEEDAAGLSPMVIDEEDGQPRAPSTTAAATSSSSPNPNSNRRARKTSAGESPAPSSVKSSPSPPLPPPECPKHGRAMVRMDAANGTKSPSASTTAASASTGRLHFRCPAQRCKERRELLHTTTSAAGDTVALHSVKQPLGSSSSVLTHSLPSSNGPSSSPSLPSSSQTTQIPKKGHGGIYLASLSQLLGKFFSPQIVELNCSKCDSTRVRQSYTIKQLPRVLILHVKRFQVNLFRGTYEKRGDRLMIDETIDLSFACTEGTRKPMPPTTSQSTQHDSEEKQQPLSKNNIANALLQAEGYTRSAAAAATPKSLQADSMDTSSAGVADASLDDTTTAASTFADLFALTARAACKCGAHSGTGGGCEHSKGVLTGETEIRDWVKKMHGGGDGGEENGQANTSGASSSSPPSRSVSNATAATVTLPTEFTSTSASPTKLPLKRKSMELAALLDNEPLAAKVAAKKKAKLAKEQTAGSTTTVGESTDASFSSYDPQDEPGSYFLASSSAETAAAAELSRIQGDLRLLQQQLSDLSNGAANNPDAGRGTVKKDTQALVLRMTELEAELKTKREQFARGGESSLQGSNKKIKSSAAKANGTSSPAAASSSPSSASATTPASLPPGMVPSYELAAIIHHKGQIATSGHYITDLKSTAAGTDGTNQIWKRYDDAYVKPLGTDQAVTYGEREGYLFFYQYQPVMNILHMQQEKLERQQAQAQQEVQMQKQRQLQQQQQAQAAASRFTPSPYLYNNTSSHSHSASPPLPVTATVIPNPYAFQPASYAPAQDIPFGPNATRFKKWALDPKGTRIVWWVDAAGNIVAQE